jgi:hypothetical protein
MNTPKVSLKNITIKKVLTFIDSNLLFGISLFLLAFIPLYPKWPLFDALPGYNVRIRLEDFFVLLTFFIWGIYVLRGKIQLSKIPLFKPILIYLIIGFLSTLSAIFITKTVTTETYQILKIFLHLFRRLEYFSLFFIYYSAISNKKQLKAYLSLLAVTVAAVTVYGFGQKYLYWPAYSTMNREFAKGIVLYLTEHARVLSTFGGHYDLAAYIMLTLTLTVTMMFVIKKWWLSVTLFILWLAQYWLLILTASRTSFIGYLAAVSITFFFLAFKKGWLWSAVRGVGILSFSMAIMLTLGPMSERFAHLIKLQDLKTKVNDFLYSKEKPVNGIALRDDIPFERQLEIVADKSDTPPTTKKPGSEEATLSGETKDRPDDVYIDPYSSFESTSSSQATQSAVIHVDYSENALKYGLSTGIRLDALWPRAIAAFKKNPLLGTGYSTLVKTVVWEQTTAESTDNDYLRLLGETGAFGFISFILILAISILTLYKAFLKTTNQLYFGFFAAGIGLTIGLMVNAMYIDVFESSKVAYSFWSIIGILLAVASSVLNDQSHEKPKTKVKK